LLEALEVTFRVQLWLPDDVDVSNIRTLQDLADIHMYLVEEVRLQFADMRYGEVKVTPVSETDHREGV